MTLTYTVFLDPKIILKKHFLQQNPVCKCRLDSDDRTYFGNLSDSAAYLCE